MNTKLMHCTLATLLIAGIAGAVGCPKAGTDKSTTATAAPSPVYWMSLKDGKLHRGLDEAPIGLYAAGDLAEGAPGAQPRFAPTGDIEGSGPIGEKGGVAGTLDLATGTFIKDGEGPKPPPPSLDGFMTASGFSPSSRHVRY